MAPFVTRPTGEAALANDHSGCHDCDHDDHVDDHAHLRSCIQNDGIEEKNQDVHADATSAGTAKRAAKRKPADGRRARVKKACERCRIKRTRCDGELPSCARCLSSGRTCQYPPCGAPRCSGSVKAVLAHLIARDQLAARLRPEPQPEKVGQPPALPPDAWGLIDTYFAYTQSWLPILSRVDVYRAAHTYSASGINDAGTSRSPGATAALWAVLALASSQSTTSSCDRDHFYRVARGLVPDEVESCELGHAQALLLLSLVRFSAGFWATASLLVGQAIQIAYHIGLHQVRRPLDSQAAPHAPCPKGKHILLGCFILDTLYSARLGRPPQLRKEFVRGLDRLDEDMLEEWDVWAAPPHLSNAARRQPLRWNSTFTELGKIHVFLNDVICSGIQQEHASELYAEFSDRLVKLSRELPGHCQLNMSREEPQLANNIHQLQVYNLHFALAAAAMVLQLYLPRPESAANVATSLGMGPNLSSHVLGLLRRYSATFGLGHLPPHLDFTVALATGLSPRPPPPTDDDWSADTRMDTRQEAHTAPIRYQRVQLDAMDTGLLASPASLTTATPEAASSPATSLDGASHAAALSFPTPSSSICSGGTAANADTVALGFVEQAMPGPDELSDCAKSPDTPGMLSAGSVVVPAAFSARAESEAPFEFIDWPSERLAFAR
ncbi:uncharacterized protein BDZ99DRAFT_520759 [Mytilinidion resinicola]|uniref:Zn(2)-C6 fungal-type domain-containing protein n=1 Tax=Mytilinidion resinicola TaxID=574789 RepID=A0A6A6YKK6_9PEZI|nr:uncharacterized protein BDZ99DRAFT_520759 [Mytilinidion resinicola]KAF2809402.1 hypothetical protein BDZ99DRAFT_520759 [Mytilinidion resinicola]